MKDYLVKEMNRSDEMIELMGRINKIVPIPKSITIGQLLNKIVITPNESPIAEPTSRWEHEIEWYDIIDRTLYADNSVDLFDKLRGEFDSYLNSFMKNHGFHSYESFRVADGDGIVAIGFKKETPVEIARRIGLSKLQDEIQKIIVPEIDAFKKSKSKETLDSEYEKELAKLKKKYNK